VHRRWFCLLPLLFGRTLAGYFFYDPLGNEPGGHDIGIRSNAFVDGS
jgi:hypothetical protein